MKKIFSIMILVGLLAACAPAVVTGNNGNTGGDPVATALAQTQAAQPVSQQQPPPQQPVAQNITATARENANCRSGPDSSFSWIMSFSQGMTGTVIGRNDQLDDWYLLRMNDGTECWVISDSINLSGDASSVAYIPSAATPTAVPPAALWAGTWNYWVNNCMSGECDYSGTLTYTMTGNNTFTGSYTTGGCTWTDVLTVSADGLTATGTETGCSSSYQVYLVMDSNHNQFRGRWNAVGATSLDGYYCGARNGYSKPNPTRP